MGGNISFQNYVPPYTLGNNPEVYTGIRAIQLAKDSGVYFQDGTLVKLAVRNEQAGWGVLYSTDDAQYTAYLKDGTQIDYRRQTPTNQAKVTINAGGAVNIFGIQDLYVTSSEKEGSRYNLYGCKGFVNMHDGKPNSVYSYDRSVDNKYTQKSFLNIATDKTGDNVKCTKTDCSGSDYK